MRALIMFNNSYCSLHSIDFSINELLPVIHNLCTISQTYFIINRYTRKPERKMRDLSFYKYKDKSFIFPRGWFWNIYDALIEREYEVIIEDKRKSFHLNKINLKDLELYSYQKEAVKASLQFRYGILKLPTGSGKSLIGVGIISEVGGKCLIIVPSKMLLYQWRDHIKKHLPSLKIGLIGDNHFEFGDVTIGIINSLYLHKNKLSSLNLDLLLIDEGHHLRENKYDMGTHYYDISMSVDASIKIALTATPGESNSIKRKLVEAVTGGIIYEINDEEARNHGIITNMNVFIFNVPLIDYENHSYHKAYEINLLNNLYYRQRIEEAALTAYKEGKTVLIITDRVDKHLKVLEEVFPKGLATTLYGETPSEEREDIKQRMEEGKIPILISTVIKEGVSIKNIDVIILAGGGKDSDSLIQKYGRGLRAKKGKSHLTLIDFKFDKVSDKLNGILRNHSLNRIKTYKKQGYKVNEIKTISELAL